MIGGGIVDVHVHASPSVLPRRLADAEAVQVARRTGVARLVLKAHEGSSAERAALAGDGVIGGVVLNSPVGGLNPDAVEISARLGGRVVWLPTISSADHQAAAATEQLSVHRGLRLRTVPVRHDGFLAPEVHEVIDVVAEHDLVLASGHISVRDSLTIFRQAHLRGARRFLINHPMMDFMGWSDDFVDPLRSLGVHLEVGCVADAGLPPHESPTARLADIYPHPLQVFGSDLGNTAFPPYRDGITDWHEALEPHVGGKYLTTIMTTNGHELLDA